MFETPDFTYYNLLSKYTNVAKSYYEDKLLGGGSIFVDKYVGSPDWIVDTGFQTIMTDLRAKLEDNFVKNTHGSGGYFILESILERPFSSDTEKKEDVQPYVDVWALISNLDFEAQALLQKHNATASTKFHWDCSPATPVCYKKYITGVARIIKYYKFTGTNKVAFIHSMWEGQVTKGEQDGIGRLIDVKNAVQFIGNLVGVTAINKGIYYEDFVLKSAGVWNNIPY